MTKEFYNIIWLRDINEESIKGRTTIGTLLKDSLKEENEEYFQACYHWK